MVFPLSVVADGVLCGTSCLACHCMQFWVTSTLSCIGHGIKGCRFMPAFSCDSKCFLLCAVAASLHTPSEYKALMNMVHPKIPVSQAAAIPTPKGLISTVTTSAFGDFLQWAASGAAGPKIASGRPLSSLWQQSLHPRESSARNFSLLPAI